MHIKCKLYNDNSKVSVNSAINYKRTPRARAGVTSEQAVLSSYKRLTGLARRRVLPGLPPFHYTLFSSFSLLVPILHSSIPPIPSPEIS